MSDKHPDIEAAIKAVGSQAELAKRCGCAQQTISKMLNREIPIKGEWARAIDQATAGKIPRWQLRPDLFDAPSPAAQPQESAA